jgi:hypothetical protein
MPVGWAEIKICPTGTDSFFVLMLLDNYEKGMTINGAGNQRILKKG